MSTDSYYQVSQSLATNTSYILYHVYGYVVSFFIEKGEFHLTLLYSVIFQSFHWNYLTLHNPKRKFLQTDDYLREDGDEYCWLFHSKWNILASFSFVPNHGPYILTCQINHGEMNLFMIHLCRWRHFLPSKILEQFFQDLIKPRMICSIQTSKWKHGCGMFDQGYYFNGIDTCSMTNFEILTLIHHF